MVTDLPATVEQVLWVTNGALITAIVAQWFWIKSIITAGRKEREMVLDKLGDLITENTKALNEVVVWVKSRG